MPPYALKLTIEAAAVAAITALTLALAIRLAGPIQSVSKALFVGSLIGACIHLAFELAGGNAYYCSQGAACIKALSG